MVHVKFKNMEKSDIAKKIVSERIAESVGRFPKNHARTVIVTLEMENSPKQAGRDLFKVRTEILGGRYHGVILEKAGSDLYQALAEVNDGLLERLNRASDRLRTKSRKQRRQFSAQAELPLKLGGGQS